jgi:hypothetical protein
MIVIFQPSLGNMGVRAGGKRRALYGIGAVTINATAPQSKLLLDLLHAGHPGRKKAPP